jgi:hypothetical protein
MHSVFVGILATALAAMTVPGGEIDPAFPYADVYKVAPVSSAIPATRACRLAARYVELINAADYAGVAALYADDAVFLEPLRPSLHGRAQIDAFYAGRIGGMHPQILAVTYLGDDRQCMVELALQATIQNQPRYVLVSVDHFVLNAAGKIQSMTAFARPARSS